jgi:hypothetical protein
VHDYTAYYKLIDNNINIFNMRIGLITFSFLVIMACGDSKNTQNLRQTNDSLSEVTKFTDPNYSINELVVNENCVIFLWPDSIEITKMQKENDEDTYNEIIADMTWYPGVAMEILDSFNIKRISCDKEYLLLKNSQKKEIKLKRKEIQGDMILFRVDKDPIISYAMEFDKSLVLKYFEK